MKQNLRDKADCRIKQQRFGKEDIQVCRKNNQNIDSYDDQAQQRRDSGAVQKSLLIAFFVDGELSSGKQVGEKRQPCKDHEKDSQERMDIAEIPLESGGAGIMEYCSQCYHTER